MNSLLEKNIDAVTDKFFDGMTYTSVNVSQINPQLNPNDFQKGVNPNNSNISHFNNLKEKDKDFKLTYEENSKISWETLKLKEQINEFIKENNDLKKENQILKKKANIDNPYFRNAEREVQSSLYESLIIYLKNINLVHLMEIYQLNLQREEEIRKILESKNIPGIELIKDQIFKLNDNFVVLKNNCEKALREYHSRSKSYICYDDFENKILEHKNFTENILNLILGKFFEKKDARKDFILFKFDHNEYNQIIEDLTSELENFHKKEFSLLENYKKNFSFIEPAIEVLAKQTILESDKLNIMFNDPNYKLI